MRPTAVVAIITCTVATACGTGKTISLLGGSGSAARNADAGDGAAAPAKPECRVDGDCVLPKSHCDKLVNKCVQCMVNEDCATLVCNTVSHTCSGCITNADCTEPTPYCDGDDRKCVECSNASECKAGEVCAFEAHRCAPKCLTSSDCAGAGHPICALATSVCVECTSDADCHAMNLEPHCDLRYGACVECLSDQDCSTGRCEIFENRCVQCLSNADCDGGRVCDLFSCRE